MAARWTTLADRLQAFALHAALYRLLGGRLRTAPLLHVRNGGDFRSTTRELTMFRLTPRTEALS